MITGHDIAQALDSIPDQSDPHVVASRKLLHDKGDQALFKGDHTHHFTVSFVVACPRTERVLVLLHPKYHIWVQPGGHVERDDPSIPGAAIRELFEETGIEAPAEPKLVVVDCHPLIGTPVCLMHYDLRFAAAVDSATAIRPEAANPAELQWLALDDARLEPSIVRAAQIILEHPRR